MEVLSYDKTLKKVKKAHEIKTKKATYPNGKPSNLIPSHIVNDRTWEEVVEDINFRKVSQGKVRLITRPVFGEAPKPVAIVYCYKQMWVAAWLPQKEEDDYYYGLTWTYKDTAAARKQCHDTSMIRSRHADIEPLFTSCEMTRVKDKRTYWYRETVLFNQQLIDAGYDDAYWKGVNAANHYIQSWGQASEIHRALVTWQTELAKDLPTFKGTHESSIFSRVRKDGEDIGRLMSSDYRRPKWLGRGTTKYVHDIDTIMKQIKAYYPSPWLEDVWSAKWFRRLVLDAMNKIQAIHTEQIKNNEYDVNLLVQPYSELQVFIDSVCHIKCIWRDMDINYLHSRYHHLSRIEISGYHSETAYPWLRENLPVESFLNMQCKSYDTHLDRAINASYTTRVDSRTGNVHMYDHVWRDTYQMLTQCIAANLDQAKLKPKRWRMQDWHDHLMAETWKLSNPLTSLPQKLFPEPIKVPLRGIASLAEPDVISNYTFLQPLDTHMLAHWGRTVRNCVGSHGYADGIKKYRHMIVLVMIDSTPRYTVQLTVDCGIMHVAQIADVANKNLNTFDRNLVEQQLQQALQIRERQLTSN